MFRLIKRFITGLALVGLMLQSSLVLGLFNPQKAYAGEELSQPNIVINEVMVNPDAGEKEWVELYNQDDEEYLLDGYSLTSIDTILYTFGTDESDPLTIGPNGFAVISRSGSKLVNAGDDLTLQYSDGASGLDQVKYGNDPYTNMVVAPAKGKTIGRLNDGATSWYANLTPSSGSSNQTANPSSWPSQINSANIKAGETNPTGYINDASKSNVSVEAELANLPDSTITAYITDEEGAMVSEEEEMLAGLYQEVDNLNASELVDGEVTPWIMITDSVSGISTEYMQGTPGFKDTIAPAEPITAQVTEGDNNPDNVINISNESSVDVDIDLPAGSEATDIITVELSDGTNTESSTVQGTDGANTVTVEGINTANPLSDGIITICAKTTDVAGNSSECVNGTVALKDTNQPSGTIVINNYATVTNSVLATLTLNSTDASEMMISNTNNFSNSKWLTFAKNTSWSLTSGNGLKTVYVKFKDVNGNVSEIVSDTINLNVEILNIVNNAIAKGANDPIFPISGLELDINANAATTLTSAIYASNPGDKMPTGINAFGKYFELSVENPETISWPIMIKMYYTASDLVAAGITNEEQLSGIYFWDTDSKSWKPYSQTGVNTDNVTVNGVAYAGYVWANANHLTPLVIGCDITAPVKPANFAATSNDAEISLSWDKVADAQGYFVRYREGTSIDNKPYITIYLPGAKSNATKVTGLKNNTLYEFGIQAIDKVGNKSVWGVIIASPTLAEVATEEISEANITFASNTSNITEPQTLETKPQETEIITVGPEEGKVKSDTTTDWTRFWLTLLILVIALGAGFGGYYGYQWWMEGGKKVKVKTKLPPKQPEKGGRW